MTGTNECRLKAYVMTHCLAYLVRRNRCSPRNPIGIANRKDAIAALEKTSRCQYIHFSSLKRHAVFPESFNFQNSQIESGIKLLQQLRLQKLIRLSLESHSQILDLVCSPHDVICGGNVCSVLLD